MLHLHSAAASIEMAKKFSKDFRTAMRTLIMALIKGFEMSPHLIVWRSHTQILLWPASGAGWPLKGLGVASPDHQVGALFEALDEGVLMAPSKSIGYFFAISSCPEVRWVGTTYLQPKS